MEMRPGAGASLACLTHGRTEALSLFTHRRRKLWKMGHLSDITQPMSGEAWVCIHSHRPDLTFFSSPRAARRMKESRGGAFSISEMPLRPGHDGVQAAPRSPKVKNVLRTPLRVRGAGNLVTGLVSGRWNNSTGTHGTPIHARASGPQIPGLPSYHRAASQFSPENAGPCTASSQEARTPACRNRGLIFPLPGAHIAAGQLPCSLPLLL